MTINRYGRKIINAAIGRKSELPDNQANPEDETKRNPKTEIAPRYRRQPTRNNFAYSEFDRIVHVAGQSGRESTTAHPTAESVSISHSRTAPKHALNMTNIESGQTRDAITSSGISARFSAAAQYFLIRYSAGRREGQQGDEPPAEFELFADFAFADASASPVSG